jgi:lysophospholipase L1-like esterase
MRGGSGPSRRAVLAGAAALPALALAGPAGAESADPRLQELLDDPARLARYLADPAMLGRYAGDNRRLTASGAAVDIVFMGDSITEGWARQKPDFFGRRRVGRGISGQTTPQMLVRFIPDVVALKPRAVHIMAGTNDIAGNTGPMTQEMTRDNFRAMSAIARQHRIRVVLASIPPAASFPWAQGVETLRPIREINRWLRAFARETGATYIDYHAVLADAEGAMRPGLATDGVHPTSAGYDVMSAVAEPVLAKLRR